MQDHVSPQKYNSTIFQGLLNNASLSTRKLTLRTLWLLTPRQRIYLLKAKNHSEDPSANPSPSVLSDFLTTHILLNQTDAPSHFILLFWCQSNSESILLELSPAGHLVRHGSQSMQIDRNGRQEPVPGTFLVIDVTELSACHLMHTLNLCHLLCPLATGMRP